MPDRAATQGIAVAVACLAFAGASGSAGAQPCVSCWDKSCPELKNYGSPACKESGSSAAPSEKKHASHPATKAETPAEKACPEGQSISPDTSGHCCWPGQVWADGRCRGVPSSCPAPFHVVPEKELCDLPACTDGQIRAQDKLHCCWAGQVWSTARSVCVGVPAHCPRGFMVKAEQQTCVPVKCDGNTVVAKDGRGCTPCGDGYAADDTHESCKLTPCPSTAVRAKDGVRCQECQSGFRADASGKRCELMPCLGNTIRAKDGVQCSPCPDGYKADAANKLCRLPPCEGNTVRNADGVHCLACYSGSRADATHTRCETPQCEKGRVRYKQDGPCRAPVESGGMVLVPASRFTMGSPEGAGATDERPPHPVFVKEFFLDKTEVTVQEYEQCVKEGPCKPALDLGICSGGQEGAAHHPIDCVDWEQASALCTWKNKRLPTEAEWELAALGPSEAEYPWGAESPGAQLCWNGDPKRASPRGTTCGVKEHAHGASPAGVLNLSGNAAEWTADWFGPYRDDSGASPGGPSSGELRVFRGGSYLDADPVRVRSRTRSRIAPSARLPGLGFRCARASK